MFATFKVKNIFTPERKQLYLSILCWVMFQGGFALLLMPLFDLETEYGATWFQIANFCATFVLTALCFLPFLKQSLGFTMLRRLPLQILMGYGMYYVMALAVSIIVMVLKLVYMEPTVNVNQDTITQLLNYAPTPMILCTCLLVPVTEECLVRGVIFAPLCRKRPLLAYVLSSVTFSVLHLLASIGQMTPINMIENFLTYLPSGIALGWMYQRTGTIIGPIALHCTVNTVSVLLTLALF